MWAFRTRIGAVVVALIAGGFVAPDAGSAAGQPAPAPSEVATFSTPDLGEPSNVIFMAGTTGFLTLVGSSFTWTRFSDMTTVNVSPLNEADSFSVHPAGNDSAYYYTSNTAPNLKLVDLAHQTTRILTIPSDQNPIVANGTTILTSSFSPSYNLRLLNYAGGSAPTSIPITGLPANTQYCDAPDKPIGDTTAAVLSCLGSTFYSILIDMNTGASAVFPESHTFKAMDGDHLAVQTLDTIDVYSRQGLLDGTDVTPQKFPLPVLSGYLNLALVGQHLIVQDSVTDEPAVYDLPLDSTSPTVLYPKSVNYAGLAANSAGDVFLDGAYEDTGWALDRLRATGTGSVVATHVQILAAPYHNAGVALDSKLIYHVVSTDNAGAPWYTSFNQLITDPPGLWRDFGPGQMVNVVRTCQIGVACVRVVPRGTAHPVYLSGPSSLGYDDFSASTTPPIDNWRSNAKIVDGSGDYVVVNNNNYQFVYTTAVSAVISIGGIAGAALWGSTLWQPTVRTVSGRVPAAGIIRAPAPDARPDWIPGSITGRNLTTGATRTITTGTNCIPSEIQVSNDWLYWTCAATGQAGARNLTTGATITLPAGHALLGNGYAVIQTGQTLKLYAFSSGALASPVTVATLPVSPVTDERQYTWTVDKRGTDFAYVDAADTVHVIDPGLSGTPAKAQTHPTTPGKTEPTSRPVSRTTRAHATIHHLR